jgi:hypothetical protein
MSEKLKRYFFWDGWNIQSRRRERFTFCLSKSGRNKEELTIGGPGRMLTCLKVAICDDAVLQVRGAQPPESGRPHGDLPGLAKLRRCLASLHHWSRHTHIFLSVLLVVRFRSRGISTGRHHHISIDSSLRNAWERQRRTWHASWA